MWCALLEDVERSATAEPQAAIEPESAFSWGDDLNDWVTDQEMTAALDEVSRRYSDADLDDDAVLENHAEGETEWRWSFRLIGDTESWTVIAHDGAHGGRTQDLTATTNDPRLPDGAVYEEAFGFAHGFYILSGPNSDELICMTVVPPGGLVTVDRTPRHGDRVLALASIMLREMGWVE